MCMFVSKMIQITLGAWCEAIWARERENDRPICLRSVVCVFFMHIWCRNKGACKICAMFLIDAKQNNRKSGTEVETKRKYLKAFTDVHTRPRPLLPFSLGCSLITLLDLSAGGWAHYPSTPALLLPETLPPFRSSPDAFAHLSDKPHLIRGTNIGDNE